MGPILYRFAAEWIYEDGVLDAILDLYVGRLVQNPRDGDRAAFYASHADG